MQLPLALRRALDVELQGAPLNELAKASASITEQYRSGKPSTLSTSIERLAYVAARMPATYAAVHAALSQADIAPRTLLDLGAGPGTVSWAAHAVFGSLESAHLIERNGALAQLGQRLGTPIPATWMVADVSTPHHPADLVVLSYALSETSWLTVLERAWAATGMMLALVEPGTPKGFNLIREARQWLIGRGAVIAAPCPHGRACPMTKDDPMTKANWCHFAARVERTSLHRRMKGAELGYEDEKFSYVLAARAAVATPEGRIIRHPRQKAGYVQLELCTTTGLATKNVPKSAGLLHRAARKAGWGGGWPPTEKD